MHRTGGKNTFSMDASLANVMKELGLFDYIKQIKTVEALVSARLPYIYNEKNTLNWHYLGVMNYRAKKKKNRNSNKARMHKYLLSKHQYYATKLIEKWVGRRSIKPTNLEEENTSG